MPELQYIEVGNLFPHPDNPRKEIGDVSELAESIKQNGIFQNLTVVPGHAVSDDEWREMCQQYRKAPSADLQDQMNSRKSSEGYTVIIGHRRLAAAKAAGLEKVPCVVADMTPKEQLQTMLLENMQRSDLTVYEQAQGFQLMLDMGSSVEEIAEKSGFSQTTVRRRVKLLDLDSEKFKESEARGATLSDYLELDKIHDPELKNKALDAVGTANFQSEVKQAVEEERYRRRRAKWLADLTEFATLTEKRYAAVVDGETVSLVYYDSYNRWDKAKEMKRPENADKVKYFYFVDDNSITLYREPQDRTETETEEERQHRELHEAAERQKAQLEVITTRHFQMRRDFINNYSGVKARCDDIMQFAVNALLGYENYYTAQPDMEILAFLLGIDVDEDTEFTEDKAQVMAAAMDNPPYALLAVAYAALDDDRLGYWESRWDSGLRSYRYEHKPNEKLDDLYNWLCALGYEMSDEEKAMQDGSHEVFKEVRHEA